MRPQKPTTVAPKEIESPGTPKTPEQSKEQKTVRLLEERISSLSRILYGHPLNMPIPLQIVQEPLPEDASAQLLYGVKRIENPDPKRQIELWSPPLTILHLPKTGKLPSSHLLHELVHIMQVWAEFTLHPKITVSEEPNNPQSGDISREVLTTNWPLSYIEVSRARFQKAILVSWFNSLRTLWKLGAFREPTSFAPELKGNPTLQFLYKDILLAAASVLIPTLIVLMTLFYETQIRQPHVFNMLLQHKELMFQFIKTSLGTRVELLAASSLVVFFYLRYLPVAMKRLFYHARENLYNLPFYDPFLSPSEIEAYTLTWLFDSLEALRQKDPNQSPQELATKLRPQIAQFLKIWQNILRPHIERSGKNPFETKLGLITLPKTIEFLEEAVNDPNSPGLTKLIKWYLTEWLPLLVELNSRWAPLAILPPRGITHPSRMSHYLNRKIKQQMYPSRLRKMIQTLKERIPLRRSRDPTSERAHAPNH